MFYMLQVYALVIVVVLGPALVLYLMPVIGAYALAVLHRWTEAVALRSARQTQSSSLLRRKFAPYSQNEARAHARMTMRRGAIRALRGQVGKGAMWRRQFSVRQRAHRNQPTGKPL